MNFKNDLINLVMNDDGSSIFDFVDENGKKWKYTPIRVTISSSGTVMFFDKWTEVKDAPWLWYICYPKW